MKVNLTNCFFKNFFKDPIPLENSEQRQIAFSSSGNNSIKLFEDGRLLLYSNSKRELYINREYKGKFIDLTNIALTKKPFKVLEVESTYYLSLVKWLMPSFEILKDGICIGKVDFKSCYLIFGHKLEGELLTKENEIVILFLVLLIWTNGTGYSRPLG